MYSLGEVIGPVSGGALFDNYGFAVTSEVIALINFIMATIALIYFFYRKKITRSSPPVNRKTQSKQTQSLIDTELMDLKNDVDR